MPRDQEYSFNLAQYEAWYRQMAEEATDLAMLYSEPATPIPPASDELTLLIQDCLKAHYQQTAMLIEVSGRAEKQPINHNTFINLSLIPHQETLVPGMPQPSTNRVMILGEAGTGKSVLSQYIAYSWSEGALWRGPAGQFKAVFWLPLKNLLNYPMASTISPSEVLLNQCMKAVLVSSPDAPGLLLRRPPDAASLEKWLQRHPEEVLYIADGLDEVVSSLAQHYPLQQLLKEILAFPNVLMTSRPYQYSEIVGNPLRTVFSRFYRNVGFREEDIKCYIKSYIKEQDQAASFLAWLEGHPAAKSIAHVPLQLSILCEVWEASQGNMLQEVTLTGLYSQIVQTRFDKKFKVEPERALAQAVLMLLAEEGMRVPSYRFKAYEIRNKLEALIQQHHYPLSAEELFAQVLSLGFLKSTYGSKQALRNEEVYYFVHLTYQEYFAACHIAALFTHISSEKVLEEIDSLIHDYKFLERYERVWWFTAGLLGAQYKKTDQAPNLLAEVKTKAKNALIYFFNTLQQSCLDMLGGYELGLLARCGEEAGVGMLQYIPEAQTRLEEWCTLLQAAINNLPGATQENIDRIPFLLQLAISPNVRVEINKMPEDILVAASPPNIFEEGIEVFLKRLVATRDPSVRASLIRFLVKRPLSPPQRADLSAKWSRAFSQIERLWPWEREKLKEGLNEEIWNTINSHIPQQELFEILLLLLKFLDYDFSSLPTLIKFSSELLEPQKNRLFDVFLESIDSVKDEREDFYAGFAQLYYIFSPEQIKIVSNALVEKVEKLSDSEIFFNYFYLLDIKDYLKDYLKALSYLEPTLTKVQKEKLFESLSLFVYMSFDETVSYKYGIISSIMKVLIKLIIPMSNNASINDNNLILSWMQSERLINRLFDLARRAHKRLGDEASIWAALAQLTPTFMQDQQLKIIKILLLEFAYADSTICSILLPVFPQLLPGQANEIFESLLQNLKQNVYSEATTGVLAKLSPLLSDKQKDQLNQVVLISPIMAYLDLCNKHPFFNYEYHQVKRFTKALNNLFPVISEPLQQKSINLILPRISSYPGRSFLEPLGTLVNYYQNLSENDQGKVLNVLLLHLKGFKSYVDKSGVVYIKPNPERAIFLINQLVSKFNVAQRGLIIEALLSFLNKSGWSISTDSYLSALNVLERFIPVFEEKQQILFFNILLQCLDGAPAGTHTERVDALQEIIGKGLTSSNPTVLDFYRSTVTWLTHKDAVIRLLLSQSIIKNIDLYKQTFSCRYLLILLGVILPSELGSDLRAVTLDNLSPLLTLTLSACQYPELLKRLSHVLVYICYSHQVALTVADDQSGPYFKLYHQGQSARLPISKEGMLPILNGLRDTYCKNTSSINAPHVFPEPMKLIDHQSVWRFFHLPKQLGETKQYPSLICYENQNVTSKIWRVGIGCREKEDFNWRSPTRNLGHAFLILEGVDQYGFGVYFRYDLCIDQKNSTKDQQIYHIQRSQCTRLEVNDRETQLHKEIQHNHTVNYLTWEIDVATEVPKLVRALERDKQRDMTPYYVSLPSSTELSAHGSPEEKMVNCLTWARDHIKNVIGTKYKGELDSRPALPVLQIKKVEPPSERTCMLS